MDNGLSNWTVDSPSTYLRYTLKPCYTLYACSIAFVFTVRKLPMTGIQDCRFIDSRGLSTALLI
jgi:hypothetical protein